MELTNSSASPMSAFDSVAASSEENALTRNTSICSNALKETLTEAW